jgi:hypothetical protein
MGVASLKLGPHTNHLTAPRIAAIPEMKLHQAFAGTIATTEVGHKSVLSPVLTDNKENKNSGCQQQHMSALQSQTITSSWTGLVNANYG